MVEKNGESSLRVDVWFCLHGHNVLCRFYCSPNKATFVGGNQSPSLSMVACRSVFKQAKMCSTFGVKNGRFRQHVPRVLAEGKCEPA